MGGGGGDTTNVTNTGLGDDQYQALADNQVGISGQISDSYADATKRYNTFDTRFGNLDTSISGLSTSMLDQFKNSTDNVNTQFTNMGGRFNSLDTSVGANNQAIGGVQSAVEGVGSDVVSGFADTQTRFDTVDTANQNIQDDVTAGFTDQAQGFSDVQGAMVENTSDIRGDLTENFADTNTALSQAQSDIQGDIKTTQANVLGGQGGLASDLSDLSTANDTYFGALSTNQENLQAGQDSFRTSFDDYVDRYSDDTTLANQTRADLQQAQANATDALRTDIGNYAQTTATGQANISGQLGDVATATGNELASLGTTVEGGFAATSMDQRQAQENLTTRLGGVRNLLQETGANIDSQTKAQYESLTNSFDAQGNLIANSIDGQGNTLRRSMDDQGNLIETKFAATGEQIGQSTINMNDALSAAENTLSGNIGAVGTAVGQGFNAATQASTDQFTQLQTGNDGLMASIGGVGAGINANIGDVTNQLASGFDASGAATSQLFDAQTNTLSQQGMKTFSDIQSQIGNMDSATQVGFKTVSSAFDAQGNLLRNSTDAMGNTIQRSLDAQGNLIEQKFNATGTQIGRTATNINKLLTDAQSYQKANLQGQQQIQTNLGNKLQENQTGMMSQFNDTQSTFQNQYDQLSQKLSGGFQNLDQADIMQTRDLAKIAASQTDLDMGMRQNFQQLGSAFDDNGKLIQNSIDAQGNTISRAVDANGNLLLRSFDATGRSIGDKVININRSLSDLGNLKNVAGANVSMGNLSPAMQGSVPTGGFMSPFATTR